MYNVVMLIDRAGAIVERYCYDAYGRPEFVSEGPVDRGSRWVSEVNRAMTAEEEDALRRSVNRGTPWGSTRWQVLTAVKLALESTLRPRGRPRKQPPQLVEEATKRSKK